VACADGRHFLVACREAGVRVVAAEGFELLGDQRQPDMGAILDLRAGGEGYVSIDEAQRFITSVCRPGLYFEFDLTRS
jgi:hypothetical protein